MTRYKVIRSTDTNDHLSGRTIRLGARDGEQEELVILSLADIADLYRVHPQTVYKAVRNGTIQGHKLRWNWVFLAHELPPVWPGDL